MEIKSKVTGFDEVKVELRNLAEKSHDHAARTMRRAANRIVKRAQDYVPQDKGNLEASIHVETMKDERRRLAIDVVAGGVVNGVDTDRYAMLIHEHYESILGGKYGKGPSPGTLAKMAKHPGKVGSKFLERAAKEEEPSILSKVIEVLKSLWNRVL